MSARNAKTTGSNTSAIKAFINYTGNSKKYEIRNGYNPISEKNFGISSQENEVFAIIQEDTKCIFLQSHSEHPIKVTSFSVEETQNYKRKTISGNEHILRTPTLLKFEDLSVSRLIKVQSLGKHRAKDHDSKSEKYFYIEFLSKVANEKNVLIADEINQKIDGTNSATCDNKISAKTLEEKISLNSEIKSLTEFKDLNESNIAKYFESNNIERKIKDEIQISNTDFSNFKDNLISLKNSSQSNFGLKSLIKDYVSEQESTNKINSANSNGVIFNMNLNMNMNMNFSTNIYNKSGKNSGENNTLENCAPNLNLNITNIETEKNETNNENTQLKKSAKNQKKTRSTMSLIDLQNKEVESANINRKRTKKIKEEEENCYEYFNEENQMHNLKMKKGNNKRKSTYEIVVLPSQKVTHIDDFIVIEEKETDDYASSKDLPNDGPSSDYLNSNQSEKDVKVDYLFMDQKNEMTLYSFGAENPLNDKIYRFYAQDSEGIYKGEEKMPKDVTEEFNLETFFDKNSERVHKNSQKEATFLNSGNLSLDKKFSNKNIIRINFSKNSEDIKCIKQSDHIENVKKRFDSGENRMSNYLTGLNQNFCSNKTDENFSCAKVLNGSESKHKSKLNGDESSNSNSASKKIKYAKDLNMDEDLINNLTRRLQNDYNQEDPKVSKNIDVAKQNFLNANDHISMLNRTLMEDNIIYSKSLIDIQKNILKLDKNISTDKEKKKEFLQQKRQRENYSKEENQDSFYYIKSEESNFLNKQNAEEKTNNRAKSFKNTKETSFNEALSSYKLKNFNGNSNVNIPANFSSFTDSSDENDSYSALSNDSSYRNRKRYKKKKINKALAQNKSISSKRISSSLDESKEKLIAANLESNKNKSSNFLYDKDPYNYDNPHLNSNSIFENSSEVSQMQSLNSQKRKCCYYIPKNHVYPKSNLKESNENRDKLGRLKSQKCFIRATKCSICLDKINIRSRLNTCKHEFCKECIFTWSELSNECPNCKEEYDKIWYWPIEEKNARRAKMVKKRKFVLPKEEQEQELENLIENGAEYCLICRKGNDMHLLLLCDECNYNVCHTYCVGLDMIPEEDWFCPKCDKNAVNKAENPNANLVSDYDSDHNNNNNVDAKVNIKNQSKKIFNENILSLKKDQNMIDIDKYNSDFGLLSNPLRINDPIGKKSDWGLNKNSKNKSSGEKKPKNQINKTNENQYQPKSNWENYNSEYFHDPNKKLTRGNRGNLDTLISTINFDMSKKVNRGKSKKDKIEENNLASESKLLNAKIRKKNDFGLIHSNIPNNEEFDDKNIYDNNEFFFNSSNFNNNLTYNNNNNHDEDENGGITGYEIDENAIMKMKNAEANKYQKSKFGFAAKKGDNKRKSSKKYNLDKFNYERSLKNGSLKNNESFKDYLNSSFYLKETNQTTNQTTNQKGKGKEKELNLSLEENQKEKESLEGMRINFEDESLHEQMLPIKYNNEELCVSNVYNVNYNKNCNVNYFFPSKNAQEKLKFDIYQDFLNNEQMQNLNNILPPNGINNDDCEKFKRSKFEN